MNKSLSFRTKITATLVLIFFTSGCQQAEPVQNLLNVEVQADGKTLEISTPAESTVQQVLNMADISLSDLDRVEPALYDGIEDGDQILVIRVREEFRVEQVSIPFEQQTLRNELLPAEDELLIQKGKNGLQEITYRYLYEDDMLVTNEPVQVKAEIVEEPIPEIRMIGMQTPIAPVSFPGTIYYIRDGNIWKMQENSTNRDALITTGDIDGRVFSISEDRRWMLFTRRSTETEKINSLWAAAIPETASLESDVFQNEIVPVNLGIDNIIHFADFVPGSTNKVIFTTVEPREAAPGWQANNDLNSVTFSDNGWTTKQTTILEANAGGVYGWWGSSFVWSPDGRYLAYGRADSVGTLEYQSGILTSTLNIIPLQTHQDWAWVPGITWGPDGKTLFTLDHIADQGIANPEESQRFDLTALLLDGKTTLHLVSQTGMFAYPLTSPLQQEADGVDYQIAYLQALFPEQSNTSRYRLTVMDRDGSNRRTLFPGDDKPGMTPLQNWGAWSPGPLPDGSTGSAGDDYGLAVILDGNLWLVNSRTGEAVQITGDGLTSRILWR